MVLSGNRLLCFVRSISCFLQLLILLHGQQGELSAEEHACRVRLTQLRESLWFCYLLLCFLLRVVENIVEYVSYYLIGWCAGGHSLDTLGDCPGSRFGGFQTSLKLVEWFLDQNPDGISYHLTGEAIAPDAPNFWPHIFLRHLLPFKQGCMHMHVFCTLGLHLKSHDGIRGYYAGNGEVHRTPECLSGQFESIFGDLNSLSWADHNWSCEQIAEYPPHRDMNLLQSLRTIVKFVLDAVATSLSKLRQHCCIWWMHYSSLLCMLHSCTQSILLS